MGSPPPSALARVMTSGCSAVGLVHEPGARRPDAGLHLVEGEQRAGVGAAEAAAAR